MKRIFVATGIGVLVVSMFFMIMSAVVQAAIEVGITSSCPQSAPYFPLDRVSSVFDKKISMAQETTRPDLLLATCTVYFGPASAPVHLDHIVISHRKMDSSEQAHSRTGIGFLEREDFGTQPIILGNIGDEELLYNIRGGPYPRQSIVVRKGSMLFSVSYINPDNQSKAETLLREAVSGGSATTQPPPSATPEITDQAPVVTLIEPNTVSAGIGKLNTKSGIVSYADNLLILKLEGKYLFGGQLSTNNIGVDGRPGIEFRASQVNSQGTILQVQMIVKPTAKNGSTTFTLTNNGGKSTTFIVGVTITGTQYLQRVFVGSPVVFKGDWADVAPNSTVLFLEGIVRSGLAEINYPSYQRLQIVPVIVESSFWNSHANLLCGNARAIGCASPANGEILIKEDDKTDMAIVHESAHKLHFYYNGIYKGVPNAPTRPNSFQKEWDGVAQPINSVGCRYLPLKTTVSWNDGTGMVPQCGFTWAYGASDLKTFFEDVATMTEFNALFPSYFGKFPEPKTDPRYSTKSSLLKKYEFLH